MGISVPRLSILIPALDSSPRLETTLVSVLENRPHDCEIVVVLRSRYDDPYDLADEVRFIVDSEANGLAAAIETGLNACRGPVVHLLSAGAEVDEGWADAALEHFLDHRIAAVAPLVLRSRDESLVCSAGIEYRSGGARTRRACGLPIGDVGRTSFDVLGPTAVAGFYRREALLSLARPFDRAVTDGLLDVDTALQLRAAGYRAVVEPRSVVFRSVAESAVVSPFAAGRGAERLFWRNAPQRGMVRELLAHVGTVLGELFAKRTLGEKAGRLVGRAAASLEVFGYRRHHREVAAVGRPGLSFVVTSTGDRVRIDSAHPRSPTSAKVPSAADRRTDENAA
jgi:GT2 family glycosyltransferase